MIYEAVELMFTHSLFLLSSVNRVALKLSFHRLIALRFFYSTHVSYTFEIISLYAVLKNVKNLKGKYFLKLNHPIPYLRSNEMNLKGKKKSIYFHFPSYCSPHRTWTCLTGVYERNERQTETTDDFTCIIESK